MTALAHLSARAVVRAVGDAAARWADADFPPRVRLLDAIAERIGYSIPVVEYALDRLFESLSETALTSTIVDELGSLDALDGFVERAGRPKARAVPVGSVCVISSQTTIGVAIIPAAFALCAKCDVVVKDREDALVRAFFQTLAEEHDAFKDAARAQTWSGESGSTDLTDFDAVAAFGRDESLTNIRNASKADARFIGFGPRASAGYITRESLNDETSAMAIARAAARDVVLYETEGCLSLHVLFVETDGEVTPEHFRMLLGDAIDEAAIEFPAGKLDSVTELQLANVRNMSVFRNALELNPPRSQPPPFLPRTIAIQTVDAPDEAVAYLNEHRVTLEALATAHTRRDVVDLAVAAGASRLTRFGELQSPLAEGNHGGRPRIAEFVRWITDET